MSFDLHITHKPEATTQAGSATLTLHGKQYEFPVISGTSGLNVIDITKLYGLSGAFTYDPGFASTASCKSDITFTDGNRGMLFYRGYPIEQLAEHGTYLETCHILLYGDLPNKQRYLDFKNRITSHTMLHEQMHRFFSGYRRDAPPHGRDDRNRWRVVRLFSRLHRHHRSGPARTGLAPNDRQDADDCGDGL